MPEANKCANCLHHRRLFFTGRKWICEDCWTDEFGPMPSELIDWKLSGADQVSADYIAEGGNPNGSQEDTDELIRRLEAKGIEVPPEGYR
jgi:hypothetical protein